jgi:hypothetical protein
LLFLSNKIKKKLAFCLFILYICRREKTIAGPQTWSCGGRCKNLPRTVQDIATPAARCCHARRKSDEAYSLSLFT